jgi:beta-glucosidase
MIELIRPALEGIDPDSVRAAMVPSDFLGINYYNRQIVKHDAAPDENVYPPTSEFTEMSWEVYPPALTDLLVRVNQEYHPPAIYITENGAAFADPAPTNGIVEDPRRVAFLQGYLAAVEAAIEEGVPVRGYFVWSLLDNFEWSFGYSRRFGIIYVDFATHKRTFKRSAYYYRSVIQHNGIY